MSTLRKQMHQCIPPSSSGLHMHLERREVECVLQCNPLTVEAFFEEARRWMGIHGFAADAEKERQTITRNYPGSASQYRVLSTNIRVVGVRRRADGRPHRQIHMNDTTSAIGIATRTYVHRSPPSSPKRLENTASIAE